MNQQELDALRRRGQVIVTAYCVLIPAIALAVLTVYVLVAGLDRLPMQLARFGLTVLFCVALYRGSSFARNIFFVIYGLLVPMGLVMSLMSGGLNLILAMSAMVSAVYISFAWVLATSRSVDVFICAQQHCRSRAKQLEPDLTPDIPVLPSSP